MILTLYTFPSFLLKFTADLGHNILLNINLWRDEYLPNTGRILRKITTREPYFACLTFLNSTSAKWLEFQRCA